MPMVGDLMKWSWSFGNMPYGDTWRILRRLFHQFFNSNAVSLPMNEHVQRKQTLLLLQSLRDDPQDFFGLARHYVGSVIFYLTYGYEIKDKDDYFIELAKKSVETIVEAFEVGTYLVDFFPALKYIPEWVPGAGFQRKARIWSEMAINARDRTFELGKSLNVESSFVSSSLRVVQEMQFPADNLTGEEAVRDAAGVAFVAGADTTLSFILTFILAMVRNPIAQARAQKEIEEVIGNDRLPDFNDRPSLPYVEALLLETLRWLPPLPLGLPHKNIKEDVYEGYFIPNGATIFANLWAILHDPITYPNPSSFDPSRFLGPNPSPDPSKYIFGLGRRVCPGRYIAMNSGWIAIAAMLATYQFLPAIDERGKEIIPECECTSGIAVTPLPFKCIIKPKSQQALQLIKNGFSKG